MATKIMLKTMILVWIALSFVPIMAIANDSGVILILRASGGKFAETSQGIKDDLGDDFNLIEKVIKPEITLRDIENYIDTIKPKLIVLVGNTPIRLYTNYQKQNPERQFPPSVALSALYVDRLITQVKNSLGIRHEIPAVTSLVNIRSLVKLPVKRVGVLYRQWMKDYIELNAAFCRQEGIELVGVEIPNSISIQKVKYHLKHLLNKDIDALWVVNDNALLSSRLMQNVWVPNIKQFNKPVVVGVEGLTATALNFGTFSVVPDQYALGVQGAGLIGDIMDEQMWELGKNKIYEPLSVKKLLNLKLMKKRNIQVNESKLETLDYLIQ